MTAWLSAICGCHGYSLGEDDSQLSAGQASQPMRPPMVLAYSGTGAPSSPCSTNTSPALYGGASTTSPSWWRPEQQANLKALLAYKTTPEDVVAAQMEEAQNFSCDMRIKESKARARAGAMPATDAVCGARSRLWVCDNRKEYVIASHVESDTAAGAFVDLKESDVSFFAGRPSQHFERSDITTAIHFLQMPYEVPFSAIVRETELCVINVGTESVWVQSYNEITEPSNGAFDAEGQMFVDRESPPPSHGELEHAVSIVMQRIKFESESSQDSEDRPAKDRERFCKPVHYVVTNDISTRRIALVELNFRGLLASQNAISFCVE